MPLESVHPLKPWLIELQYLFLPVDMGLAFNAARQNKYEKPLTLYS